MSAFDRILEKAAATQKRIVLPEASDDRVLQAAVEVAAKKLAKPILIGNAESIAKRADQLQLTLDGVDIVDPSKSPMVSRYIDRLVEKRAHRGMDKSKATEALTNTFTFACMMMDGDDADGCVAGAITPTADVVRGAMQLVQKRDDTKLVSSFFIMRMLDWHPVSDVLIIADCALVIDPDAEELAAIGASTGDSVEKLLDMSPEIGMLSFSTAGSARHKHVSKVRDAAQALRKLRPNWRIVGEVQLDAAVVPDILAKKLAKKLTKKLAKKSASESAKESANNAPAQANSNPCNTLIFPTLDAGNIGYKLIERFGGAQAIGPILQGLIKPVNDLSRGCSQNDIVNLVAVTSAQCD